MDGEVGFKEKEACNTLCHEVLVAQLYCIFVIPMDRNPPGSSVHGIFQARIQEWVAISSSREPSRPWNRSQVSCIAR